MFRINNRDAIAADHILVHLVYSTVSMAVAQENFEKLMARINEKIYEGIKKGAASPIIQLS